MECMAVIIIIIIFLSKPFQFANCNGFPSSIEIVWCGKYQVIAFTTGLCEDIIPKLGIMVCAIIFRNNQASLK